MDHFALKTDSLYISNQNKTLHRNFMGYTSRRSEVLLGLGVSAISETPTCFHQNEKVLNVYGQRLGKNELPTHRGHILTAEDSAAREQILKLMTVFETELEEGQLSDVKTTLAPLLDDALVEIDGRKLSITDLGRPYLRNVCMALDRRLRAKAPQTKIFSQAL
jgi:coproporphyrinogen III oxidase-like Fe-S oxidoreductase